MRFLPTKRVWKRLAIGAAICIAVALIANGFMIWLTEHRVQSRIDAIRASGDPATIADLAPVAIPDEQNAAAQLLRIKSELDQFDEENARFYRTPIGKAFGNAEERDDTPTPEQLEAIRQILDAHPEIDTVLLAASNAPQYASLLDYSLEFEPFLDSLLENAWPIRSASRFTEWRMRVLVHDNKRDEAVTRGIAMLRLGRFYENEPGLVSFLVSIAVRSLAITAIYDTLYAGPITPETHLALDRELAQHEDSDHVASVLRRERPIGFGSIDRLAELARVPFLSRIAIWPAKAFYLQPIDLVGAQISVADRPFYEIRDSLGSRDEETGLWNVEVPPSGYDAMDDMLLSSLRATYEANARNLAMLRALRIVNALFQYRDLNGTEAQGLDDLSLPKEATIDPFSGKPLKLKHIDDGWIVYSVARNGVDDGGDFKDLKDYGIAPAKWRQTE
jgi:hypothetical protein